MRIVETYSNGFALDHLQFKHPVLWSEIESAIQSADGTTCITKRSKEKTKKSKTVLSPVGLNNEFKHYFTPLGWKEYVNNYYVCSNPSINQAIWNLPKEEQKKRIIEAGLVPCSTKNQTDFVKDKIAIEVQFGKYAFIGYDLLFKHTPYWVQKKFDIFVEVLPMKSLQVEMSTGIAYFENEMNNLVRLGRGQYNVPLVMIGIDF